MKINPPDHPVIVTEAPWNTPENRQRMAQIMFEEFKVPAFYIANNAVLSSYAHLALLNHEGYSPCSPAGLLPGRARRLSLI